MPVASFFNDHSVLFALICSGVAIAYGVGLTVWLLRQPDGNERMKEISRAVQEGAAAYLRRNKDQSRRMFHTTWESALARALAGPGLPRRLNPRAAASAAARERAGR